MKKEELIIIRDSNNKELIRLETEILHLTKEKERVYYENQQLAADKNTLLDYIEELSGKNKN